MEPDRVTLGRIVAVHGLAGEVAVRTENDDPANISRYGRMQWQEPGPRGRTRSLDLAGCRLHRGAALLKFEGIDDRDAAEPLVGGTLSISRSERLPPPDDAIYVADLIGMSVVTRAGDVVGRLTAVYPSGANDIYGVDTGGREVLIPAVEPIVTEVDLDARRITIDPPDGLLD